MDVRWSHPFTCLVAGSTGSGKSIFVEKLIKHRNEMIYPIPEEIILCYKIWQPSYERLKIQNVKFVEGLPGETILDGAKSRLIVIDDLMSEVDQRVTSIFTEQSHHLNISVILILQNLFLSKNKEIRTISLNAHYLVIFKNPRDKSQIIHLGKQMFPGQLNYVTEAFKNATEQSHGYLLLDCKQETPENLRLRTSIFPGEIHTVYIPKQG